MEAVILAGGFGTRLRSVVKDLPKPMAPINGQPFLKFQLDYLRKFSVTRVVLAVGYKSKVIKDYFGNRYYDIDLVYSVESTPLKTGGALKKALTLCREDSVLVLNGDTFFDVDLKALQDFQKQNKADIVISIKEMKEFNRYGTIKFDEQFRITGFEEKKPCKCGYINGGVYLIQRNIFRDFPLSVFMLEKDFLERKVIEKKITAFLSKGYFIDIGVPEDYRKAILDFKALI
ncbi:MAG: nucleotidyltransferase family protein [Acidaminococcus sp.]|jgi:D-glycero-alpha-D-manno-heptose 1-phosphate guanylyltransferase|nr:nucleotidyltransferase family protein [Acidaminococcus sp.]MCI2116451.1 nucleotidyltransferase family protein [Acidaminococcus sp.]